MSYPIDTIAIIDERGAPLTAENTPAGQGSITTVMSADVVVRIGQDGVFVEKGIGHVRLITPKSDAQMSGDKSQREAAAFAAEHRNSDAERDTDAALHKGATVWGKHPAERIDIARQRASLDQLRRDADSD